MLETHVKFCIYEQVKRKLPDTVFKSGSKAKISKFSIMQNIENLIRSGAVILVYHVADYNFTWDIELLDSVTICGAIMRIPAVKENATQPSNELKLCGIVVAMVFDYKFASKVYRYDDDV